MKHFVWIAFILRNITLYHKEAWTAHVLTQCSVCSGVGRSTSREEVGINVTLHKTEKQKQWWTETFEIHGTQTTQSPEEVYRQYLTC